VVVGDQDLHCVDLLGVQQCGQPGVARGQVVQSRGIHERIIGPTDGGGLGVGGDEVGAHDSVARDPGLGSDCLEQAPC
jgi:hypothetical protein